MGGFGMENKYIATLMSREYKPTGAFIFTCQYVITGDYDEETQTFIDAYGNEYYDMVCCCLLFHFFSIWK